MKKYFLVVCLALATSHGIIRAQAPDTLWTRRYNGLANGSDIAYGCAVDTMGNLYVTGYSHSGSNWDYLTIKYDIITGDTCWTRRYNGPANSDDCAKSCIMDGGGYLYVTGGSNNG